MKVLVTGSEGFIGSHLIEELLKKNFKVRAMVLYNSFNSWGWLENLRYRKNRKLEIVLGDIRDKEVIDKNLRGIDIVINLAALIGIPYSYSATRSYLDTNTIGLLNILNAAKQNQIRQLIHMSTSEVYGTPKKVPINEDFNLNAQSPYAASKIAADQLALSFYRSFNLPITIIRPFNTFGPRQSARAVIPTIISQAMNNQRIKIGSVYPKRDFVYVKDTVRGIVSAINNKKTIGEVINLGSGYEISIKDLISKISKVLKKEIIYRESSIRKRPKNSEVTRLLACTKKAKKLLNWKTKYSGKNKLEIGLKETIEWFRDKKNLSLYKHEKYNY